MADRNGWLRLAYYLIGFVVCVVLPGFITIISPVSRVSFERDGSQVSARTHIRLFLLVPFRSMAIDPVVGIDERRVAESFTNPRTGPRRRIEEQGFLVIQGHDRTIDIPVSPTKLEGVRQRALDFLSDPQATELKMTLVASWFVSAIGGVFSILTVFYLLGLAVSLGRFLRILDSPRKVDRQPDDPPEL